MKKIIRIMMFFLLASGILSGAFVVSESELLPVGALVPVAPGNGEQRLTFTPAVNGDYDVCLLPTKEGSEIHAQLWRDGELLAEGSGAPCALTCRLTAGETYELRLRGEGAALAEIARSALSRSAGNPLELADGEGYSKLIARGGDVHWYAVTAIRSGAALMGCRPEDQTLSLEAMLFDESGRPVAQSEMLPSGACVLSAELASGGKYLLRVAARDGGTGKYVLTNQRSAASQPPAEVELADDSLTMEGRSMELLQVQTSPYSASPLVFFDSADSDVAFVHSDGTLESRAAGETTVVAYGFGGVRDSCGVIVTHVSVEGVNVEPGDVEMVVGDEMRLDVRLIPENASQRGVTFVTGDEQVVSVSEKGVITATGSGETQVAVVTADGGHTDVVRVRVSPAPRRYRALLIGEQNYASTVEDVRHGSTNSVESIAKLLGTASMDGEAYEISTLIDAPRDTVVARIRETFAGATESDVSLVYITCHGFYRAGMSFFLMADGSVLSAAELEKELRAIPGQILLLADCCGSGGMLGASGEQERFLDGVTGVFQGTVGSPTVHGSKVRVLASALLDQDSYRISFSDDPQTGMATVFARALCDAAGWSIDKNARSAMNADADYDGDITLDELATYMSRRVNWYLDLAGDYIQTVNVYPEGDSLVVMQRG